MLEIYDEKVLEIYPNVKRLLETNPPEYDIQLYGKRNLTEDVIKEALKGLKEIHNNEYRTNRKSNRESD